MQGRVSKNIQQFCVALLLARLFGHLSAHRSSCQNPDCYFSVAQSASTYFIAGTEFASGRRAKALGFGEHRPPALGK
tara:strand:- start:380 stop:610 length:231 start_codon:yes stop_codon:yes gene_type:complete